MADKILTDGFVILPSLLSSEEVSTLTRRLMEHVKGTKEALSARCPSIGVGSASGFHEVVLRSPGRWDFPCDPGDVPPSITARIQPIVERVLFGRDCGISTSPSEVASACMPFFGLVRADPGCPAQLWHADSGHRRPEHTPPHLLNVLLALRDVSVSDGPTEIVPGSHVLTNHHRPDAKFGSTQLLYQSESNGPELVGSCAQAAIKVPLSAGSVLIFDDRVLHRGGANVAESARDLAFFTFCRPQHVPNIQSYYEATRSIATYDHRGLAEGVRGEFPGLTPPGDGGVGLDGRGSSSSGGGNGGGSGSGGGGGGTTSTGPPIFADGASGSQLHQSAIDAAVRQMQYGAANVGGGYGSSLLVDRAVGDARDAMSDFMNCAPHEVVFGPSMTSLTFHVARALERHARLRHAGGGDTLLWPQAHANVVLDPFSHHANISPWVRMAEAVGAEVRWLPVVGSATAAAAGSDAAATPVCTLDARLDALSGLIDEHTALVAFGAASNGVGSVHDVPALCAAAKQLSSGGAHTFVDAVHYAPHVAVDVQALGCDILACSPYKFFAPHAGTLYGRESVLAALDADRLSVQTDELPCEENCNMSRMELGTQSYESLAGTTAAVDYLASVGTRFGGADEGASRRCRLESGWRAIGAHENEIKKRFLDGAAAMGDAVRVLGHVGTTRDALEARTCTFAVSRRGLSAAQFASALVKQNIWCTAGNHYAQFWGEHSGGMANDDEGMARIGFLHYNTLAEVDRVLEAIERCKV